jgi:hypothetical protein
MITVVGLYLTPCRSDCSIPLSERATRLPKSYRPLYRIALWKRWKEQGKAHIYPCEEGGVNEVFPFRKCGRSGRFCLGVMDVATVNFQGIDYNL